MYCVNYDISRISLNPYRTLTTRTSYVNAVLYIVEINRYLSTNNTLKDYRLVESEELRGIAIAR